MMGRGRFAADKEAEVAFFEGRNKRKIGDFPTGHGPQFVDRLED